MSAPSAAVTRIRTWVASATTKSTNHYTITAIELEMKDMQCEVVIKHTCKKNKIDISLDLWVFDNNT